MKDLAFGGIKVHIPHLFQFFKAGRSFWKSWPSICELRARYIAVSPAKSLTLDLTCSGRSLMYTRKSIGPRTEPCGTPEETGIQFRIHSVYDYCLLPVI